MSLSDHTKPVHACGAEQKLFGVQCQLPFGHDDPHRHEDANGITTWEPVYVDALRREVIRLKEALIPFAFIGREFMEPLGLAEEYDHARELLGLNEGEESR